jgi:hypothetical protein
MTPLINVSTAMWVRRLSYWQKSLSSGSGGGQHRRFRSIRKRVFMDLSASWAGDLGVFRHLFFVFVGHLFEESGKRRTAVLAMVVDVLVGHSGSLSRHQTRLSAIC